MSNQNPKSHLLKASDIEAIPETVKVHYLNHKAVRNTKSLSDAVGMKQMGVHLVRVEPGKETTEFHFHHQEEEFIYIISGKGIAEIDNEEFEVVAGDFLGFSAPSLPHSMKNIYTEDLVYLIGGERRSFEVVDYPRVKKRLYRVDGERKLIDWEDLKPG